MTEVFGAKVFSGVVNARQRETTRSLNGSDPTGLMFVLAFCQDIPDSETVS